MQPVVGLLARRSLFVLLAGALGAGLAIALMLHLSARANFPLFFVPFATSIVLVMGMPRAEPARPRALIGGHLLATMVGLAMVKLVGPAPWAAATAVGLAIVAMQLTRTFHPPAGINPLLVVVNDLSWDFLLVPVAVGGVLLALFAAAWSFLVERGSRLLVSPPEAATAALDRVETVDAAATARPEAARADYLQR